jgi:alpha-tubulin suppressor-like RCC1 family protein
MLSCTPFSSRGLRTPVLALSIVVAALGCREDPTAPSEPESTPALMTVAAEALSFKQISAGGYHTCAVTQEDLAYCWGDNVSGQLGDGTYDNRSRPTSVSPTQSSERLQFLQVSSGIQHTCGVTLDNQAYCWGQNGFGQLGIGSASFYPGPSWPTPVAGGLRFREVAAGGIYSCGVTVDDRAYCWGSNFDGQLGDGTTDRHLEPVAVAGGRQFRHVVVSEDHTCGLNPYGRAFCWGANDRGQLGDGSTTPRLTPARVAGGLEFKQLTAGGHDVEAGSAYTCGVTRENLAYCWGSNLRGQLGDGTTTRRLRPVQVAGGRQFRRVTAAGSHTCALNSYDRGFCWGANDSGQLGDGTTTDRRTPTRVAGGLLLDRLSAGSIHTCGLTTGNRAYCWGHNNVGMLGDGTNSLPRPRPVAVVGPA